MARELAIDRIIRSRRRTVALEITPDARLVVRAGLRTPHAHIERFVSEKRRWIARKLAEAAARPRPLPKNFTEGEAFPYLGREYALSVIDGAQSALRLAERFLLARRRLPQARETFVAWYRREAARVIGERVMARSAASGIAHAGWKIGGAAKRWGSCGGRNTLNFSWRLVMAPPEVIDYVVAHELAHVEHKDHSRRFWRRVEELCPRYGECERWLKDNGHALCL